MDRAAFTKALAKRLYPILRAEGFRGSGSTLRRFDDPVVHVFNVQGSSGAERCYLNFGAHLMFLPMPGGGQPDAKTLKEYECAFRDRFEPPPGPEIGWFYGETEEEMNETIAFICEHWAIYGHGFFERYSQYPSDFLTLVNETDETSVHPTQLLTIARIAVQLKENARAQTIVKEALGRCPERATGLKAELERILRQ